MADPDYKYGNFDFVNERMGLESDEDVVGTTVPSRYETIVNSALVSADGFVDSEVEDAGLPLPTAPYHSSLRNSATYYALFDCLLAVFSSDEEKNNKAQDYLDQAYSFIQKYIRIERKKLANSETENNPTNAYSVSKSHMDTCHDMDEIIR